MGVLKGESRMSWKRKDSERVEVGGCVSIKNPFIPIVGVCWRGLSEWMHVYMWVYLTEKQSVLVTLQ